MENWVYIAMKILETAQFNENLFAKIREKIKENLEPFRQVAKTFPNEITSSLSPALTRDKLKIL